MKQIHYFDIDNDRLYMSSEPAYLDEAETRRQGKEVYFCPYNATLIKPPVVQENESARFNGESWEVVTNYRGKYQVNENMEVSIVTELGELEEGYILITEEQAQQIENDRDYYIIQNGELVINPNWEEIQRQKEEERINNLTMTALDFINFLKQVGLTDQNIEDYLNANLAIKHQLQFCQNVYCGVAKALMPIKYNGITITAEMVEQAFRIKNGEGVA